MLTYTLYDSPLGLLTITFEDGAVVGLSFATVSGVPDFVLDTSPLADSTKKQLDEYFCGLRKEFDLPLRFQGTPFRRRVWEALRTLPYGVTCTYQDVAVSIDSPNAVRALGSACKNNPIPIIIPCHRVLSKSGALSGYLGIHVHIKDQLLQMEKRFIDG